MPTIAAPPTGRPPLSSSAHLSHPLTAFCPTLEQALEGFLRALEGKNRSQATIRAYTTDVRHFVHWLHGNNLVVERPDQVERMDVTEYMTELAHLGLTGVTRARKIAAVREYFRYLVEHDWLIKSPAQGVETPKKEKTTRTCLRPDEYSRLLSESGSNPRDFAILQVFLQTGVRVSELCDLRLADVEFESKSLRVRGKGMITREIDLEKKGCQAIKNWLTVRASTPDDHLFLNKDAEPISERGVRKIVSKYRRAAGITKRASCHSLRHTFASYKAEKGVSPFQLKEWLGHANLNTTQIYVHMARQNGKKVMEATSL